MILYGCYTRQFVAWPKFPVTRPGVIIRACYPGALIDRLDQAEQTYRLRRSDDRAELGPSGPEQPQP